MNLLNTIKTNIKLFFKTDLIFGVFNCCKISSDDEDIERKDFLMKRN